MKRKIKEACTLTYFFTVVILKMQQMTENPISIQSLYPWKHFYVSKNDQVLFYSSHVVICAYLHPQGLEVIFNMILLKFVLFPLMPAVPHPSPDGCAIFRRINKHMFLQHVARFTKTK